MQILSFALGVLALSLPMCLLFFDERVLSDRALKNRDEFRR